jgi:RHS repeat-associated protein
VQGGDGGPPELRQRDPLPGEGITVWRSYYLAGGVRIAMRTVTEGEAPAGVVTYLLGDHLNSTSVSVDGAGNPIGTLHYKPFGEVREAVGETPTDYTYTGQREEAALGLMYYVARWYDPHIAHFVQADTIVPGAGNPAAWNRYGYVMYNPVRYVDPSGHFSDEQLKRFFGEDWKNFISDNFSENMESVLRDTSVDLGDLIVFNMGDQTYTAMFVLDEDDSLALWDVNGNSLIPLSSDIDPLSIYNNQGANRFTWNRNFSGDNIEPEIQLDQLWFTDGNGRFVAEESEITGFSSCGIWCIGGWALVGYDVYDWRTAGGSPDLLFIGITISILDSIETEKIYRIRSYDPDLFQSIEVQPNWPLPGYEDFDSFSSGAPIN